jgi:outer membrane biosynthesis protein TonB
MNSRVRKTFALMLLSAALSGCASFHRKPPVVPPPPQEAPELSQTPLYSPEMNENAPRLPTLPAASDTAAVKPPPPPQKPHHVKKTKPVKTAPGADSPAPATGTQTATAPVPETSPALTSTSERKPTTLQASTGAPSDAASPIGDLTAGSAAEAQQTNHQTEDLIKTTREGVQGIKRSLSPDEKKTVAEIWAFLNRAEQALKNGDGDGAYGLATKAKLLLDELTQP